MWWMIKMVDDSEIKIWVLKTWTMGFGNENMGFRNENMGFDNEYYGF